MTLSEKLTCLPQNETKSASKYSAIEYQFYNNQKNTKLYTHINEKLNSSEITHTCNAYYQLSLAVLQQIQQNTTQVLIEEKYNHNYNCNIK